MMSQATAQISRLRSDFKYYAEKNLRIKAKSGETVPFKLNHAQQYIHDRIERQRAETGKVRAIILKGRQQGCSTYVEGRFYWRTSLNRGLKAFILTHEDDATKNLFEMAQRYHEHSNLKPSTTASNAKELVFNLLDSGYKVGTAGNKSVGRSSTNQLFHGSEVAFWPHAKEHAKGIIQTIPDEPGTESILESTGNGIGNYYHQQWKLAESGQSDYIAIFVPWYWQDEYRKTPQEPITYTDSEQELVDQYGLDADQIFWRRRKIVDLSAGGADGEKAFMQEYPMNATEAFQVSGSSGLIQAANVLKARKVNLVQGVGPVIMGVDPSRGGDRFAITIRQGRKVLHKESHTGEQVDVLGKAVSKCVPLLDKYEPAKCFIDAGGGADLADRLKELGYKNVKAISFGASPINAKRYVNKRGEMWGLMAEWIKDENLEVDIPDDDEYHADLLACPYERDSHDRIILWKKKKIKEEYGFSPDYGDSLALTFAEPVIIKQDQPRAEAVAGGWMN